MAKPRGFNKDRAEYMKRNPNVELSATEGNPANIIRTNYDALMSIQDPVQMAREAVKLVKPLVGKGMSEQNYTKFVETLKKTVNKGLSNVMSYLSNYMLAADGQKVYEDIQSAMATLICEHNITTIKMTLRQIENRNMCFKYGLHVGVVPPTVV